VRVELALERVEVVLEVVRPAPDLVVAVRVADGRGDELVVEVAREAKAAGVRDVVGRRRDGDGALRAVEAGLVAAGEAAAVETMSGEAALTASMMKLPPTFQPAVGDTTEVLMPGV
jgi:hypothetical protein